MQKQQIPLLEYSANRTAVINPDLFHQEVDLPKHCVICFFNETIQAFEEKNHIKPVHIIKSETINLPIYETIVNGQRVALIQGFIGGPGTAFFTEILITLGFETFLVCGGAGALYDDIGVGNIIIPTAAIRDEGTSYHYLPPSREVEMDPKMVAALEKALTERNIPHQVGKTWTTDAFFRETSEKVALRKSEGALVVEMEAATFFALAQYRNVTIAQILYAGDNVSGEAWDSRDWDNQSDIRTNLLKLSLEICLEL